MPEREVKKHHTRFQNRIGNPEKYGTRGGTFMGAVQRKKRSFVSQKRFEEPTTGEKNRKPDQKKIVPGHMIFVGKKPRQEMGSEEQTPTRNVLGIMKMKRTMLHQKKRKKRRMGFTQTRHKPNITKEGSTVKKTKKHCNWNNTG